eukprot:TRINITY_DN56988_c0_g1_i1.p1 TRINITY_DN56988_c0_g1~~TRINITY_DN56988_c0_g1_i1.p1  ORF type:complete len:219 (-),score=17.54 TRINITY_DN56988_c0_g1_i1:61-684(-)
MPISLMPKDIECPKCSWTLLTGGMTEEAHEAVCGPVDSESGLDAQDPIPLGHGTTSGSALSNSRDPFARFIGTESDERPAFNAGEDPRIQIEIEGLGQARAESSNADSNLSCLFQFSFNSKTDFVDSADGSGGVTLKLDAFTAIVDTVEVPEAIGGPDSKSRYAEWKASVKELACKLAVKARESEEVESKTFNLFSGTFVVEVRWEE